MAIRNRNCSWVISPSSAALTKSESRRPGPRRRSRPVGLPISLLRRSGPRERWLSAGACSAMAAGSRGGLRGRGEGGVGVLMACLPGAASTNGRGPRATRAEFIVLFVKLLPLLPFFFALPQNIFVLVGELVLAELLVLEELLFFLLVLVQEDGGALERAARRAGERPPPVYLSVHGLPLALLCV